MRPSLRQPTRALVGVLALACVAAPVHARSAPRPTEAQVHYREGGRLLKAKQYAAAIEELERALALGAAPPTLYDLAQAHRGVGHPQQALVYLQLFARLSPRSPLRFLVKAQMAELEAQIRAGASEEKGGVTSVAEVPPGEASAARITPPEFASSPPPPSTSITPEPPPPVRSPELRAGDAPAAPTIPPDAPALASAANAAATTVTRPERPRPDVVTVPAPPEDTRPARGRDPLEIVGAALIVGGSALLGAGAGAMIWGRITADRTQMAAASNPLLDEQAHVQSSAGAVCAVGGVMAALIGGGILWRQRTARVTVAPTAGGARASIGFSF